MARTIHRVIWLLLIILPTGAAAARGAGGSALDHVIIISVDGLRSDALLALPAEQVPHFRRLMTGSMTLNARTDPQHTVTLPNHVGMVTGRLSVGSGSHGWTANVFAPDTPDLHAQHGSYVPGMFDVAHDRGIFTAIFTAKEKLRLIDVSFDEMRGAPDPHPPDHGRDKVDRFFCPGSMQGLDDGLLPRLTDALLEALAEEPARSLTLVHYGHLDLAGHAEGWDLTPGSLYLRALVAIDVQLGRVLDAIAASDALRGRTGIILTTDHGGGAPFRSHLRQDMWVNYIIPFIVWIGPDSEPADLYTLNATTRADPGLARVSAPDDPPPIRNSDAANLALDLLNLPAVPSSTVNAGQTLRIRTSGKRVPQLRGAP